MVGGIALPGECPFCDYNPKSEIIAETKNFYLVPSVGQIVEGYVLLCSKKHIFGMADLKKDEIVELKIFLKKIRESINEVYGPTVVWEHGSTICAKQIGGCLNHAHFNIFPIKKHLVKKLDDSFNIKKIDDISSIGGVKGSYIFLIDDDEKKYILQTNGVTPSQYFRKIVAKELRMEEKWDWRTYIGEKEFVSTIKKLRPILKNKI